MEFPAGPDLYDALVLEGFQLHEDYGEAMLTITPDGEFQLVCVVNLNTDDFRMLGRALAKIGQTKES